MAGKSHSLSIIGTGLIGASIGKAAIGKFFVKGFDKNEENAKKALEEGALDEVCKSVDCALDSNLVVISIPVQFIPEFLSQNRKKFKNGSVVIDTGSTKEEVVKEMAKLPIGVQFVGGHPIAGKEVSGPENADASLFKGKKFVLTKERRLTKSGEDLVAEFVSAIGAVPVSVSAALHDEMLAYTSHFPYFASVALFKLVLEKKKETPEIFEFAGSGLRDTTRIASGDPLMSAGMLETNKKNVLKALENYIRILNLTKDALENGRFLLEAEKVKKGRDEIWTKK